MDSQSSAVRFGAFRFDPHTLELERGGEPVPLAPQPARLLALLVAHPGQMVTRQQIREHVWGDQALDFDSGLHTCVRQVRKALGDDSDEPRYVETLPRRGYRFIGDVQPAAAGSPHAGTRAQYAAEEGVGVAGRNGLGVVARTLLALSVVVSILGAWWWLGFGSAVGEAGFGSDRQARLVVLPFRNLSGQQEYEYLGAALAEEVRNELARIRNDRLGVIAATSSARYAEEPASVSRIASDLDVSHLLEGSIRAAPDGPVASVRLIRAVDETQLWAHRFRPAAGGAGDSVLDVARRVADSLAPLVGARAAPPVATVELAPPEARRAYLEASFLMRPGARDPGAAIERLERALVIEPGMARARALLADALRRAGRHEEARRQANRAVELEPDLYEAHLVLGDIDLYGHVRPYDAEPHYRRALELAPGVAVVQHSWAGLLLATRRPAASLEPLHRALALDPVSPIVHGDMPWYLLYARDYDGVVETTERALELVPDPDWVRSAPVYAAILDGDDATAAHRIRELLAARDAPAAILGRVEGVAETQVVRHWLGYRLEVAEERDWGALELARLYAMLGQGGQAVAAVRQAMADRASGLVYVPIDPRLDAIRSRPDYPELEAAIERLLSS